MKRLIALLTVVLLAFAFAACGPSKKTQRRPDYDKVRQNAEQAHSEDLQNEEDKKGQDEEE